MKELKKKLIRVKKLKFTRNVIIGIVSLIIVAFIVNITPGYRRDKYTDIINLVIDENDMTEELKNEIYVNKNGTIYMSEEDIKYLFDSNIYYDKKYNQIITTSYNKVANISIDEKKMTVNNTVNEIEAIIKINDKIYLPISNMEEVYNIKTKYVNKTNRVIIDNLKNGMIKAKVVEDVEMNFKPRTLSKKIGLLKAGQEVSCFYTTSKGWRQIRTETGIIGYIKANKLGKEYIIRQDTKFEVEAKIIKSNVQQDKFIYIDQETKEIKTWKNINVKEISENSLQILEDYKARTEAINTLVDILNKNNVQGININLTEFKNTNLALRFIIEIAPKLRKKGITTCVTIDNSIKETDYNKIVDYIAK